MEMKTPESQAKSSRFTDLQASSTKGLDYLIFAAIGLIFFLIPIFFTGQVAQGLSFDKMILFYFLVLFGVVAWVTKGVILGELNIKRTPLDYPILAILVFYALSTFFSVSAKDSLIGSYGNSARSLVAILIYVLFYYLAVNNLTVQRIKTIFWMVIASGSLVTIYSLLQLKGWYILPMAFTKAASFNPLGSLSSLTQFIIIILPFLVVGTAQITEIFPKLKPLYALIIKIGLGIIMLGALLTLALLNGFTFWPVAIVSLVIVLMFFLAKIIKISTNNLLIPLFVFLFLIILLVLGNFSIMRMNLPAEVSLSRLASWDIAKASLRNFPLLGSGPSTFYYSFSRFKTPDFNSSPLWNVRFDAPSGAIFNELANVGPIATLALVVVVMVALSIIFLTLIKITSPGNNSIMLALFASFISAILIANLFALSNSLILYTIIISILAVSAALIMYPERFKTLKLSFRASPKYALALAAIFLCVSAGVVVLFTMGLKMYLADVYAQRSILAAQPQDKIDYLNKAIGLAAYEDPYYLTLANNYMSQANQAAVSGQDMGTVSDYLSLAIQAGRQAVDISPNNAANNEALGLIYENASFYTRGALEWAETYYNKEIQLEPNNPIPNLRLALISVARSNADTDEGDKKYDLNQAITRYDEALAKKNDLAAAYYGKAVADEKLNNVSDAIEQLKKANLIDQSNLDYRFELGRMFFNRGVTQPNLTQTASQQIAENAISPEEQATTGDEISVEKTTATGGVIKTNDDLTTAEQLFLSILVAIPNHANARYSLAVLYQKTGDLEKAKIMVKSLLNIITDEATQNVIKQQFPGLY